jgi:hypothetical protein
MAANVSLAISFQKASLRAAGTPRVENDSTERSFVVSAGSAGRDKTTAWREFVPLAGGSFAESSSKGQAVMGADRRQFIGLGFLATASAGLCVGRPEAFAGQRADFTVFDPRFPSSRAFAIRISKGDRLVPFKGDVTDLALWLQARARQGAGVFMEGVTPEAAPFCLRQMVPHASLSIRRVDQDLFRWTIRLSGAAGGSQHG